MGYRIIETTCMVLIIMFAMIGVGLSGFAIFKCLRLAFVKLVKEKDFAGFILALSLLFLFSLMAGIIITLAIFAKTELLN